MGLNQFIEEFHNGEFENIKTYFSDLSTFFKVLKRRGLFDEVFGQINYNSINGEEWENDMILYLYETDREKYHFIVEDLLSDVKYINGDPYLIIDAISELSALFCDDRNESRSTVESILAHEEIFDRYYDTTDDVVTDVIEDLNPKNIELLKGYIVEAFGDQRFEPDTELLEIISEPQQNDGMAQITYDNIDDIIKDKETLGYLLDTDEFSDFEGELRNLHSSAYNYAYESDAWEEIWSELSEYFEGEGKYFTVDRNGKKIEYFQIKIKDIDHDFIKFIKDNLGGSGYHSTLSYYGSYLSFMDEQDCIRISFPDYPSWNKIKENINDLFSDYF
jgi:hypothetical protein